MKLIDLEATETRTKYDKVLTIGFSQETYDKLQPYRENREAAGFVRLAVKILLNIMDNEDGDNVADEIVDSCETIEDLARFAVTIYTLVLKLERRARKIRGADQ